MQAAAIRQRLRDGDFQVGDRIVLTVPSDQAELVTRHGDWIKNEVLATEIQVDGDLAIARVSRRPA